MNEENSTETPTGNAGIRITIDDKVLDALDELHQRVTDARLLLHCENEMRSNGHEHGDVCLAPAKKYLDESCEDFDTIFDAIGWGYEDRRKRQTELDLVGGA